MASIQAPGIGSDLDVNNIVSQLIDAERAPTTNRLDSEEALIQARLSAVGLVKSSIADFQTSVRDLSSLSVYQSKTVSVGNESLFSASVNNAALPGSYSVEVKQLAQSQKLVTSAFSSINETIGSGTLSFRFGSYDSGSNIFTENTEKTSVDVVISVTNNSLQGIRDAVNAAEIGVTASILNDGTGDRLIFSSETGANNSLEITVTDDDGNATDTAGLSQLAYDPTAAVGSGQNLGQTLAALDALLTVDGINVTRETNSVAGVITGVTLDLKEVAVGSPTTLSITENKANIRDSVQQFVDSYNALRGILNNTTDFDADAGKGSLLTGDADIRSINSQMQRVLSSVVTGLNSDIRALGDIGITSARDGTLTLDGAKLETALNNNIDDFAALFATTGRASDSQASFVTASSETKVGDYALNITQLATKSEYSNVIGAGAFTIDANNDTFKLKVDGLESGLITLDQQAGLTGAQLAAAIQTKINGDSIFSNANRSVEVGFDSGSNSLVINSSRYGSDSTIEVTEIDINSSGIGLTIKSGATGLDIAGTIGGFAATGIGQRLTGSSDAEGLQVDVSGGVLGARGSVSYTQGFAQQLLTLADSFLSGDGLLTNKESEFNQRIDAIADRRVRLDERLESYEERLRSQFLSLDLIVAQLKTTSDFLTQQFAALSNNNQ